MVFDINDDYIQEEMQAMGPVNNRGPYVKYVDREGHSFEETVYDNSTGNSISAIMCYMDTPDTKIGVYIPVKGLDRIGSIQFRTRQSAPFEHFQKKVMNIILSEIDTSPYSMSNKVLEKNILKFLEDSCGSKNLLLLADEENWNFNAFSGFDDMFKTIEEDLVRIWDSVITSNQGSESFYADAIVQNKILVDGKTLFEYLDQKENTYKARVNPSERIPEIEKFAVIADYRPERRGTEFYKMLEVEDLNSIPATGSFSAIRAVNGRPCEKEVALCEVVIRDKDAPSGDLSSCKASDVLLSQGIDAVQAEGVNGNYFNIAKIPLIKVWPLDSVDFKNKALSEDGITMVNVNGEWKPWKDVSKKIVQDMKPLNLTIYIR